MGQIMKEYEDLEKLKKMAVELGFAIGPCTLEEDEPYVKIKIEIIKKRENGTEYTNNID